MNGWGGVHAPTCSTLTEGCGLLITHMLVGAGVPFIDSSAVDGVSGGSRHRSYTCHSRNKVLRIRDIAAHPANPHLGCLDRCWCCPVMDLCANPWRLRGQVTLGHGAAPASNSVLLGSVNTVVGNLWAQIIQHMLSAPHAFFWGGVWWTGNIGFHQLLGVQPTARRRTAHSLKPSSFRPHSP